MANVFAPLIARLRRLFALRLVAVVAGLLVLMLFTGLFQQTQLLKGAQHYQIISQLRALDRANLAVTADALKIRLTLLPN